MSIFEAPSEQQDHCTPSVTNLIAHQHLSCELYEKQDSGLSRKEFSLGPEAHRHEGTRSRPAAQGMLRRELPVTLY